MNSHIDGAGPPKGECDTVTEVSRVTANDKVRRFKEWLGLSLREIDAALGYTEGRTYSYMKKERPSHPSRDFLLGLIQLGDEVKKVRIDIEYFFDGLDTDPQDHISSPSGVGIVLPYRGYLPRRVAEPEFSNERVKLKVDFSVPPGSGYWRMRDDAFRPMLQRNDLLLVVPAEEPSDEVFSICESGGYIAPYLTTFEEGYKLVYKPMSPRAVPALDDIKQIGIVVEISTMSAAGVRVAIEAEAGITPRMLEIIGRYRDENQQSL
jgi:hypothetical protein